jgi:inhibitor of cysteine peptidase
MPTITLTQSENGQSFNARTGDQIVVRLEESPTTGYRWAVDHIGDILALQSADFSSAGSGVGGGGERTFTFTAQRPGSTSLSLKLWRDWEGDSSVIKRFEAGININ